MDWEKLQLSSWEPEPGRGHGTRRTCWVSSINSSVATGQGGPSFKPGLCCLLPVSMWPRASNWSFLSLCRPPFLIHCLDLCQSQPVCSVGTSSADVSCFPESLNTPHTCSLFKSRLADRLCESHGFLTKPAFSFSLKILCNETLRTSFFRVVFFFFFDATL